MNRIFKNNLSTLSVIMLLCGCNDNNKCPTCSDVSSQHEFIKIENENDIYIPYKVFCFKQNINLDNVNNKIKINLTYFYNDSPLVFSYEEIISEWYKGFSYSKKLEINEENLYDGYVNREDETISLELSFFDWDSGGYIMIDFCYYVWYYDLNDRIHNI